MAKQYGKIMTVWFGNRPTIVVSDYGSVWEVLVTKSSDFASRSMTYRSKFMTAGWRTLSTLHFSDAWYNLRKGAQSSFFHPANVLAQTPFQESDVQQMIRSIGEEATENDGVVNPLPHIRKGVVRLIGRLCFGPDFREDEYFVEAMDVIIEDTIKQMSVKSVADFFPFLRHIPGFNRPFLEAYKLKRRIEDLISPFLDQYHSPSSSSSLFEMFILAVDSTSLTIAWALVFLIHDQQIQDKLYKELIGLEYYGKEGALGLEQSRCRHNCYGEPLCMLHDPAVWKEADHFDPERFLQDAAGRPQGKLRDREEEDAAICMTAMERSFFPFGAGRRICAGMELAKPHVALGLGNLVKAFQWSSACEGKLTS
ncbi:hypothetical protein H6P81_010835 [Aristolochia fimbriata]|uniref:Cytochrome P450 n=1 Tax=Aristolochia fimbriata TaxID=158543 RepID=A0AAV7EPW6_ARIFI|nr:hypothetical protein H6P81_010835 [Aristolochia fimbriata]